MTNYEEARVKLTNTHLNKLKSAAKKIKTKKNFQSEKLSHELFLSARQKTKIRNSFAYNMSMDIKLYKVQLSKIIQ